MPAYSICATNYNCGHAIPRHLKSVYDAFEGADFEYVIVDNFSRDRSWDIIREWQRDHANFIASRARCTMGTGRNLAVKASNARALVIVDTDVVYTAVLRAATEEWLARYPGLAIQAPFAGLFPRELWDLVRGRRSLNTYEDVDMWMRLVAMGKMRWCLSPTGENLKSDDTVGGFDHLARRYPRHERIGRLMRREWDLWKTREYEGVDIEGLIRANSIDMGLGAPIGTWVENRPRTGALARALAFGRFLFQILRSP